MKILIVDDNPQVLDTLKSLLGAGSGHELTLLSGPSKGVPQIDLFDLVITDGDMPDLSGRDFIRNIRASYQRKVPIILYSGDSDNFFPQEINTLDYHFILKPDAEELLKTVDSIENMMIQGAKPKAPAKEINLEITATGGVQMLQDDSLDLCELGCVQTKRASHVEFDNEKQHWFVQSAKTLAILKDGFKTRGEAIEWEKQYYSPDGEGWPELTKGDV